MFKLENAEIDAVVVYKNYTGETVSFNVESIVNRRIREKLKPKTMFKVLNAYIKYKGTDFQDKLFTILRKAKDIIIMHSSVPGVEDLPLAIVHDILDIFDFDDVREFIVKKRLVKIPPNLPSEYDISRELNGKGSRAQTYIRDDYVDLITLTTILKATTCVLGNYANVKDSILGKQTYKEYVLFGLYRTHKLYLEQPIFLKILESIEKLSERLLKNTDALASHVIGKGIPVSVIPVYATAMIVINKLLLNDETDDNELRNTITKIYTYAPELLNLNEGASKRIKIKHNKVDDNSETTVSVFEPGNTDTSCTYGQIAEFKFNSHDPIRLARHLGLKASEKEIFTMINAFNVFVTDSVLIPLDESFTITSWIISLTMDPRAMSYLEDEVFVNMALSVLWLYEHEFYDLALICSSIHSENKHFAMSETQRNKLSPELKEQIDITFPFMKQGIVNAVSKGINYAEVAVNDMSKQLSVHNLYTILPSEILLEYYESDNKEVNVPSNIKSQLTELVLAIDSI